MKNKLINEVNKEFEELEVIRNELKKTIDFYKNYDGSDTTILYLASLGDRPNRSDDCLLKKICKPIGIDFRTFKIFVYHQYDKNGKRVKHGNDVTWEVKKKLRDYYTKATETEDDINKVKHEQEKQIRKKLINYRKENKLSMSALAKIFGLNESTIREFINDGDRKLHQKNYEIILSNLKHLENE